jgi:peptide chain release factor 1
LLLATLLRASFPPISTRHVRKPREFPELSPVIKSIKALKDAQAELTDTEARLRILKQTRRWLVSLQRKSGASKRLVLESEVRLALPPKEAKDERDVILSSGRHGW